MAHFLRRKRNKEPDSRESMNVRSVPDEPHGAPNVVRRIKSSAFLRRMAVWNSGLAERDCSSSSLTSFSQPKQSGPPQLDFELEEEMEASAHDSVILPIVEPSLPRPEMKPRPAGIVAPQPAWPVSLALRSPSNTVTSSSDGVASSPESIVRPRTMSRSRSWSNLVKHRGNTKHVRADSARSFCCTDARRIEAMPPLPTPPGSVDFSMLARSSNRRDSGTDRTCDTQDLESKRSGETDKRSVLSSSAGSHRDFALPARSPFPPLDETIMSTLPTETAIGRAWRRESKQLPDPPGDDGTPTTQASQQSPESGNVYTPPSSPTPIVQDQYLKSNRSRANLNSSRQEPVNAHGEPVEDPSVPVFDSYEAFLEGHPKLQRSWEAREAAFAPEEVPDFFSLPLRPRSTQRISPDADSIRPTTSGRTGGPAESREEVRSRKLPKGRFPVVPAKVGSGTYAPPLASPLELPVPPRPLQTSRSCVDFVSSRFPGLAPDVPRVPDMGDDQLGDDGEETLTETLLRFPVAPPANGIRPFPAASLSIEELRAQNILLRRALNAVIGL